ncbi:MAG: HDOD domain-containing protein [Deltaproteobacteria bacterium]|nr:HDOD domain-containing protein [Deltaproteobacteria bacterium]
MQRIFVPSGSYVVSTGKQGIVKAYLGTCVGVTICDRQSGVGGLIHLLLPAPISAERVWQPEVYASTGLPLFLQALYAQGTVRERLEAYVAGGALVGPLSERDLEFDIGGRTTDIVESILNDEGIIIRKAETGGYFSCRLSLDLESWKTTIEPVGNPASFCGKERVIRPGLKEIDRAIERLNPIPQIALKIVRMISDEKFSIIDIAKEIRQDQVISAKVIRLCNSALFGVKAKVDSIDRALILLGQKILLQLVVSASLEDFFPEAVHGYSLCKGGLFKHALGTAMISERLAEFTGRVSSDIAYTAGLLHDIGKVVLDQYVASDFPFFYRRTHMDGADMLAVEQEKFGITHTEIGSRLADHWSLHECIKETIMHHHYPERAGEHHELTHVVYLADLIMSRFQVRHELERINTDDLVQRLGKIGIAPEQFSAVIDSIPCHMLGGYPAEEVNSG